MVIDDPVKTQSEAIHNPAPAPQPRRPRAATWIVTAVVCLVLAFLIYSGIHSRVEAEANLKRATQESAVPVVAVVDPKPGSTAEEIALPGNTQAFIDTPVYARTNGYLRRWYVDIGTRVHKGQLLAEIETPELDQQLAQAQAELNNAKASLQLAQITAARWKHLLETNSVSKQETDQAISDLSSKQALVASNEANVRRLQELQSFEHVYAPFDGIVTARNVDIGALIEAGQNTAPKELFHIASINKLRVYVPVPEVYAASIKTGEKVTLTLDEFPGQTFTGAVARNSDAIDPASRTLNVEVDVDNPKGQLLPGAYAFVHLKVPPTAGAVTVPANSLIFRKEGMRVAVVRNGKVQMVPITIGHDYGDSIEVVAGLAPSDAIVIDPSDSLEDGARVQVATKETAQ
jgi:RND family efflux transporter MFP subunit